MQTRLRRKPRGRPRPTSSQPATNEPHTNIAAKGAVINNVFTLFPRVPSGSDPTSGRVYLGVYIAHQSSAAAGNAR